MVDEHDGGERVPGGGTVRERDVSSSEVSEESSRQRVCPECGGSIRVSDNEKVCSECGLVVGEDRVDHGPEWRAFSSEEHQKRSRVGAPNTKMLHDEGLSTKISWKNKDSNGNQISSRKRQRMGRLRKWNSRIKANSSKDQNLQIALAEISRMGSALGIPEDMRETASVIYRKAFDEGLLLGRSIEGVATACLYIATRQHSAARSLDEMAQVSKVGTTEIGRTHRYVKKQLNIPVPPSHPKEFVPRFVSELGAPREIERCAIGLCEYIHNTQLCSGKDPTGLAGAAIYLSSQVDGRVIPQEDITDVADVTEVTIRNRYQDIHEFVDGAHDINMEQLLSGSETPDDVPSKAPDVDGSGIQHRDSVEHNDVRQEPESLRDGSTDRHPETESGEVYSKHHTDRSQSEGVVITDSYEGGGGADAEDGAESGGCESDQDGVEVDEQSQSSTSCDALGGISCRHGCGRRFDSESGRNTHEWREHGEVLGDGVGDGGVDEMFECRYPHCDRDDFQSEKAREIHEGRSHSGAYSGGQGDIVDTAMGTVSDTDLSPTITAWARAFIRSVDGSQWVRGDILGAASLYAAGEVTDEEITQKEIEEETGVDTISCHYQSIFDHVDEIAKSMLEFSE